MPCSTLRTAAGLLTLLLATPALATLPGAGADLWASDSHERPVLTQAEEDAWLTALVAHSPHRRALEMAKATVGDLEAPMVPTEGSWLLKATPKALTPKKGRRLYGYLPYWTMKGIQLHWAPLTQLSWFCAELGSDGNFDNLHGWGGADAKALIKTAHSKGVQVTLTITLFSKTGIHNVIATAAKRSALATKITNLVISGGGDGVNIDFEGMAKEDKQNMVAFITLLNKTMKAKLPGADVTLATPAVDWSGAWDYDVLAENSDGMMIMAYGLHWSGGSPGPNLPMGSGSPWAHKTLPWVVDDYVKYGKAKNIGKFIVGLPLYGHVWPSASDKPGAKAAGKGKSVTIEKAQVEAPTKGGWKWEPVSQSSYYVYKSAGQWMQTWVDTPKAFEIRVKYLDKRGTQMGLWALGYADTSKPVWDDIGWFMDQGKPSGGGTDAGSTDAGGTDAGTADTGGGTKDAGATSDAGVSPDTAAPDTTEPDTTEPDTSKPDTSKPDTSKPDTSKPDTGAPDTGTPADTSAADTGGARAPDTAAGVDGASSDTARAGDGAAATDGLTGGQVDGGGLAPAQNLAPAASSGCTGGPGRAPSSGGALLLVLLLAATLIRRSAA